VERTNTFVIEGCPALWELAENCARLCNEVNFERRHAYIRYRKFSWYPKDLYRKYAPFIGSATAQQIINKNNEAWRSFLALKRLEAEGRLPKHITRVSMPRYWKRNGRRELRIIVRNDCYSVGDEYLYLSKRLKLRYKGELKWNGKQGRLEIVYDEVDEVWRGFMTVKVEKPPPKGGKKPLYIDLGVINLTTTWFEGLKQPIAFSGRTVLSDWWYWTARISKEQSKLARTNGTKTSRKLRKLYRIRQKRFRHAVNAMVKRIVEGAHQLGISKIVLGRLKGIRNNNQNGKANAMINNFWSFNYIVKRFKERAEEYGIKVEEKSEYGTSSECPFCHSKGTRRHRGLFYCGKCDIAMNADVVGALNIARNDGTIIPSPSWGRDNWVVAHPLLLTWDGMRWKPRRAVKNRSMNTPEARISRLQPWRVSNAFEIPTKP
jgi:putative transposase